MQRDDIKPNQAPPGGAPHQAPPEAAPKQAPPEAAPKQAPPEVAPPPTPGEMGWFALIGLVKAAIVAFALDAVLNAGEPRYRGKAMRLRVVGYIGTLFLVPTLWRLRGRREPYPKELDLLVALPLLADAGGNAAGIYQHAHVDDAIHFANGALFTAAIGAVVAPRTRTAWEAAGVATAIGTSAAAIWEVAEWTGAKFGARGMDLSYDDTMADLIETIGGAALGGLITLLRHPARLRRVPGGPRDPVVNVADREPEARGHARA